MPHVVLSDGLSMAYRESGRGSPLLLVHGWAAHGGLFKPQLQGWSTDWRVISVDLRGHGASTGGDDAALTTARLAEDLAEFVQALDLRRIVAVGWSMGALVLWKLCLGPAAGRIAALVVEDMSPRIVNDAQWNLGLRGGYDAAACEGSVEAMTADWPGYCRLLARSMLRPGAARDRLSAFVEAEFAGQAPHRLAGLWRDLGAEDLRADLARIEVPTLVVQGRHGLYEPETARYLEGALPNARSVQFARSGHAPHLEEPELFNRTISDFANQALSRSSAVLGANA